MGGSTLGIVNMTENAAIERTYLSDLEEDRRGISLSTKSDEGICWFRIAGMFQFGNKERPTELLKRYISILSGIVEVGGAYAFLLLGTRRSFEVYAGTQELLCNNLLNLFRSNLPGIDVKKSVPDFKQVYISSGGIVTGYPEGCGVEDGKEVSLPTAMDSICRGMNGEPFAFCVTARRIRSERCRKALDILNEEMKKTSGKVSISRQQENLGISQQITNYNAQKYLKNLENMRTTLNAAVVTGLWTVNISYGAGSEQAADRLRCIIKSSFSSSAREQFEQIRCVPVENTDAGKQRLQEMIFRAGMASDTEAGHPLGDTFKFKYRTIMDSKNVALCCMLPQTEVPGFYIDDYVEFDSAVRQAGNRGMQIGEICKPGRGQVKSALKNEYSMDINDLTRHALIVGITGGGKTNTAKALLSEIYLTHGIPFMVVESAKREYIELMNLEGMDKENGEHRDFGDLKLFTLGSEDRFAIKYRINPFEVAGDGVYAVALQTHIDYLLATFKASFDLYPPMPHVLETAVYGIYRDRGWDIVNNSNCYGWEEYPTLTDLYYKIDEVVDSLGYHQEVQSNVKAALKTRINSLRIGGKGAMLDTAGSVPIGKLLNAPVVMELEDIGDDGIKAFVIGLLMVQLYEYRKSMGGGNKALRHVLLVEEAHRLLKNTQGGSDEGQKANSVEFFCNLLAEIRSFGQGIIIADQIPTKLASDTIKNTNLKIVHRTVMKEDREIIGASMNMTEEQIGYLSTLRRGCAAVYAEGDHRPKLVMMPLKTEKEKTGREELLSRIRRNVDQFIPAYGEKYSKHFACGFCRERCKHFTFLKEMISSNVEDFETYFNEFEKMPEELLSLKRMIMTVEETFAHKQFCVGEIQCLGGYLASLAGYSENRQYALARDLAVNLQENGRW